MNLPDNDNITGPSAERPGAVAPRMSGSFSLTGAGAFSMIIWVLYSLAASRGWVQTNPEPMAWNKANHQSNVDSFFSMRRNITEIHGWISHKNRDGVPNWLLPQINATTIEEMNIKLDKISRKLDALEHHRRDK